MSQHAQLAAPSSDPSTAPSSDPSTDGEAAHVQKRAKSDKQSLLSKTIRHFAQLVGPTQLAWGVARFFTHIVVERILAKWLLPGISSSQRRVVAQRLVRSIFGGTLTIGAATAIWRARKDLIHTMDGYSKYWLKALLGYLFSDAFEVVYSGMTGKAPQQWDLLAHHLVPIATHGYVMRKGIEGGTFNMVTLGEAMTIPSGLIFLIRAMQTAGKVSGSTADTAARKLEIARAACIACLRMPIWLGLLYKGLEFAPKRSIGHNTAMFSGLAFIIPMDIYWFRLMVSHIRAQGSFAPH